MNSHYIDGILTSKDSPKLHIQSCKFEHDIKQTVNNNIVIYDVASPKYFWFLNLAIMSSFALILGIFILVVKYSSKKCNQSLYNISVENGKDNENPSICEYK